MEGIFTDWKNSEYRGSDDRDVAFGVECDVGALAGSGTADTEHATVRPAAGTRATNVTSITNIICRAKSMLFLYLFWGCAADATTAFTDRTSRVPARPPLIFFFKHDPQMCDSNPFWHPTYPSVDAEKGLESREPDSPKRIYISLAEPADVHCITVTIPETRYIVEGNVEHAKEDTIWRNDVKKYFSASGGNGKQESE